MDAVTLPGATKGKSTGPACAATIVPAPFFGRVTLNESVQPPVVPFSPRISIQRRPVSSTTTFFAETELPLAEVRSTALNNGSGWRSVSSTVTWGRSRLPFTALTEIVTFAVSTSRNGMRSTSVPESIEPVTVSPPGTISWTDWALAAAARTPIAAVTMPRTRNDRSRGPIATPLAPRTGSIARVAECRGCFRTYREPRRAQMQAALGAAPKTYSIDRVGEAPRQRDAPQMGPALRVAGHRGHLRCRDAPEESRGTPSGAPPQIPARACLRRPS